MTQWYPRLCVYSDFQGWQNHQFAGSGEFALTFGNFKVAITVPADHVVGATGECQNYATVLDAKHLSRWQQAQTAKEPVQIFTLDEAKKQRPPRAAPPKHGCSKQIWFVILPGPAPANLYGMPCLLFVEGKRSCA